MDYLGTVIGWPLDINVIRKNSSNNTFGMVRKNTDGSERPHQGWDFYAKEGTPCYAISNGEVKHVEERGALGLMVVISIAGTGKHAAYCHLSRSTVHVGDRVLLGELIGLTGNSGNAVGMVGADQHLHFEIREQVITGTGLAGRISPLEVFGKCPLKDFIARFPS